MKLEILRKRMNIKRMKWSCLIRLEIIYFVKALGCLLLRVRWTTMNYNTKARVSWVSNWVYDDDDDNNDRSAKMSRNDNFGEEEVHKLVKSIVELTFVSSVSCSKISIFFRRHKRRITKMTHLETLVGFIGAFSLLINFSSINNTLYCLPSSI